MTAAIGTRRRETAIERAIVQEAQKATGSRYGRIMQRLTPALTAIMYDNEQIAVLDGAAPLPVGARVQIGKSDYIVNNVGVGIRHEGFDLYYDTHLAEVTGGSPSPLG